MRLKFLILLQGRTPQAPAVGGLRSRREGRTNCAVFGGFFYQQGTGNLVENQAAGEGCGCVCVGGALLVPCVCALFMGHIGYISLKTKNIFFFIIKVFRKN